MDCKTDKVDLGKRNVIARELTPRELDAWLGSGYVGKEYPAIVDQLYGDSLLSGDVILLASDLEPEDLLDIPPHKMELLCQRIKALNPFFVRMLEKLDRQLETAGVK
jgi:hypothetical protein